MPLFLAVTVPYDPVFQMIWPDNNLIGTTLLKLLLQEKLQAAGVLADGIIGHLASGLNASFFAITTGNRAHLDTAPEIGLEKGGSSTNGQKTNQPKEEDEYKTNGSPPLARDRERSDGGRPRMDQKET